MRAVLGLGGNLGARRAILRAAVALLEAQPGLQVVGRSLVYENPPFGPPQPDYLNAALLVDWVGTLDGLFAVTCRAEQLLLRERRERWGPRTLDIDLLLASRPVHTAQLTVPHPRAFVRPFVLAPLRDLLPGLGAELDARLAELDGPPLVGRPDLAEPAYEGDVTLEDDDLAELLCDTVGALCLPAPARVTAPFVVPNTPEAGLAALIERIDALSVAGFRVARAAVTQRDGALLRGVFLGESLGVRGAEVGARTELGTAAGRTRVRIARPPA